MSAAVDETVSVLNDLIEACKDGQQGFLDAAENAKDPELKKLFLEVSHQRARFAGELQNIVQRLGKDPATSGSVAGAVHRRWIDVKSMISGHDDHKIIAECERGEDVAVESYEEALKHRLPGDVRATVEEQFAAVKTVHDQLSRMKHAAG